MPSVPIPDDLRARPIQLSDNARTVLQKRYLRRGNDGNPAETEAEMFWRVAYYVALAEQELGGDVIASARRYYEMLTELRFFPNSPTFTGAGTPLGQLAACFTAAMRVTTAEGLKQIADLEVGEWVLTHEGRYRRVSEVFERPYTGSLLKIRIKQIGTPLEVTPEHPIMTPQGWVKAGDLKVGDYVAIGKLNTVESPVAFDLAALAYPLELEVQETADSVRVRRPSQYQNSGLQALTRYDEEPQSAQRNHGNVYFQIKQIEAEEFSGTVYNCEVEEDHSYVTEGVVVHNCFVLAIDDDMGRSESGIFQTLRNAALIQQTGGGNGFSFSRLRPKGALVNSSRGEATGPVGFLRVYDQAFGEIAQGGSRRGANMAVLRVDHPDVRTFITSKTSESHITNFNISVGITDDFMKAVESDTPFDLINPHDGKVWETVRAREIFDLIVKYAHHNGEPGVLFLDAANRANPVPHLYELESTNPCGEQYLGPFENCCLGSINLAQLPIKNGQPDWATFEQWIETSTRFLDDVVSANTYVPSVPQLAEAAQRVRRIGLGIMGLADLMYRMGVRYGSEEGQEFAGQVTEFLRYHAMRTSIELAKERGAFPAIKGSLYDPDDLKWQPPTPLFPYSRQWARPILDWNQIVKGIKDHGIRNGAQTTVAPTGTIATVSGCEGYGCEPVFALAYIRHVNDKGRDLQLQYTSPLFEQALHKAGLSQERITRIVEYVNSHGSCQGAPDLPESLRHTFVISSDVTVDEHIRMQAAMQRFVDNAISKTVNAPADATEEDVAKAYQLGWKLGCKGLTVYVTGSREKVVLETHATAKAKQDGKDAPSEAKHAALTTKTEKSSIAVSKPKLEQTMLFYEKKKPRPRRLTGRTYRVGTPLGATYITINENGHGEGNPFELFIHTSKAGSETAAVSEAIGRLSSMILRMASPLAPRDRMREIIKQLEGIGGERSIGFGAHRVRSLPDGVAQVLKEYLEETVEAESIEVKPVEYDVDQEEHVSPHQLPMPIGDLCPDCGEASVVNEEGCRKCYSCGYSEC